MHCSECCFEFKRRERPEMIQFTWDLCHFVEGYKLYCDNMDKPIFTASHRQNNIGIKKPVDNKRHVYLLTSFIGEQESDPAVVVYDPKKENKKFNLYPKPCKH